MRALGRHTVLINAHPWLQPESELARLYDEVHHLRGEALAAGKRGRSIASASRMVSATIDWLSDHGDNDFFLHLHLMDPHEPLAYSADAELLLTDDVPRSPNRWDFDESEIDNRQMDPEQRVWLNAAYDGALHAVDRELGRLFAFLDQSGLTDSTLVVVTSDHGESLFEIPHRRGHGGLMFEPIARVPLILRYPPGIAAKRVSELSESIDVLPTVMSLTDAWSATPGLEVDGIDLLDRRALLSRSRVMGPGFIRSDRYKIVLDAPPERLLGERPASGRTGYLYDLEADPGELSDRWDSEPSVVEELLDAYRRRLREPFREFVAARRDLTPDYAFAFAAHFVTPAAGRTSGSRASGWTWPPGSRESLRAASGSQPVDVELRVPSGRYRLLVEGSGRLRVEANVGRRCGSSADETPLFDGELRRGLPLGEVSVCEARLSLRLSAEGEAEIRRFGFRPLDEPAELEDDAERDRLLESLGYVN